MIVQSPRRVPILVYHHVYADDTGYQTSDMPGVIRLSEFVRQMSFLRYSGWTTVLTSHLVDWLLDGHPMPEKSCLIHFDNGWLDTFTIARPVLADFQMIATCFPITSGLDAALKNKPIPVRTQTEGWVENPFMTWSQAARLVDDGWELGAHTHTHCKIADKHSAEGDAGVLREAEVANERFEHEFGRSPPHFAYPSGSRNARTDELLLGIYRSLRLWSWEYPIHWAFTDQNTPVAGIRCQNIDSRVPFGDFERIFAEAAVSSLAS